jgi:hemerythrin superfamily protein
MNAITMLKNQHREVANLFRRFEAAQSARERRRLFEEIADALAVHAAIEERHFYPAVKDEATEGLLHESVEEHLEIKRLIADLLQLDEDDESFDAKVQVLQEDVEGHVEEEESDLFPEVERRFDEDDLESLAETMAETQANLLADGRPPRDAIPGETAEAAPI